MALENNEEDIEKDDAEIDKEEEIYVMVSSPIVNFATTINRYIALGYEPHGKPVTDIQCGVITMHQSLVNKIKLEKHLNWCKEKEEILCKLKAIENDVKNTTEELRIAKINLYSIPGAHYFFKDSNIRYTFGDFVEWLLGRKKK